MPLKKNTKMKNQGGDWCIVSFKYEKLGIFYFVCGMLGHSEHKCALRFSMAKDTGVRGWSTKIRAENKRLGGGNSRWLREEQGAMVQRTHIEGHARAAQSSSQGGDFSEETKGVPHAVNGRDNVIIGDNGKSLVITSISDSRQVPLCPNNSQIIASIDKDGASGQSLGFLSDQVSPRVTFNAT